MIRYVEFETAVQELTSQFFDWRHLLPVIPIAFRLRFISVLKKQFSIPDAYDIVMASQTLTDEKFHEFLANAIRGKK